jgi:hypothetical protein
VIALVPVCIATAALCVFLAVASEIPVESETKAPTVVTEDDSWARHDVELEELVRERLYGGPLSPRKPASRRCGHGSGSGPNGRLT